MFPLQSQHCAVIPASLPSLQVTCVCVCVCALKAFNKLILNAYKPLTVFKVCSQTRQQFSVIFLCPCSWSPSDWQPVPEPFTCGMFSTQMFWALYPSPSFATLMNHVSAIKFRTSIYLQEIKLTNKTQLYVFVLLKVSVSFSTLQADVLCAGPCKFFCST